MNFLNSTIVVDPGLTKIDDKMNYDQKLLLAIMHPLFAEVDTKLRRGNHLSQDDIENHIFITDFYDQLQAFYRSYKVELIQAPESFYYLRPKSTSIMPVRNLNELDMMVGKILCYLYLSPERLAQQGIFSKNDVYDELVSLIDVKRLLKAISQRRSGSDIDRSKLAEKISGSINTMRSLGIITIVSEDRFVIHQSCFRFGADVRNGETLSQAQHRLITLGEAVTPESLAAEIKLKKVVGELEQDNQFEDEELTDDNVIIATKDNLNPLAAASIARLKREEKLSITNDSSHDQESGADN